MTAKFRRHREWNWDVAVGTTAILLTCYLWLSTHVYIFIPWVQSSWEEYAALWIFYMGLVNLLTIMSLSSFFMAAFTSPGEIGQGHQVALFKEVQTAN